MNMQVLAALVMLGAGAEIAAAQSALRSDRAIKAMPTSYSDPLCDFKGTHWKTTAGTTNLKNALEATDPEKRAKELDKGKQILLEAIEENKQYKSSTAWFTLARVYLYQGDVVGADSALARAQTISPKCAGTIEGLRYAVWIPVINAGAEFAKAGNNDSALALFRQAAAIYPDKPQAALAAGVILANSGQPDSAIPYFAKAAEAAERGDLPEERNQAMFNLAAMLQQTKRHQEAAATLEQYLGWKPDDTDAKRALAMSYRAVGQTEKAERLEKEVLAAGGSTRTSAGGASVTAADAMRVGVTYYNEKKWAEAAQAFEQAVAAQPYSRDPLYNLAATYLAMNDGVKLVQAAEKLVAMEPMSEDALKLLGNGYRQTKQSEEALTTVDQLISLPVNVAVEQFTATPDSATLAGAATGRAAQTAKGKPISPAATALVFEFLGADGNVVATQGVELPALKESETSKFTVRATGKNIVGWRYRRQ